jgi:glycogen debranching enzyme
VTEPWTFTGEPVGGSGGSGVTLVEGSNFCISDAVGDVVVDRAQGLFVRDTRVLSRWELTVDGSTPQVLAVQQPEPYTATFVSRLAPRPGSADSTVLVVRHRHVGDGMREDLTVRNTSAVPMRCAVALEVEADFADLFEVKDGRAARDAALAARIAGPVLRLVRERGGHEHGVELRADSGPVVTLHALQWTVDLAGHGEWHAAVEVVPMLDGVATEFRHPRGHAVEHSVPARRLQQWRANQPVVHTGSPDLAAALRRSVADLGSLRIYEPSDPQRPVVAAGAPWYMALFGRDSLITSWMVLPFDTTLAVGTLQTLAEHQGVTTDPRSEEEPGRILHEIRFGPATRDGSGGPPVYYGTADATALFVMLVGELARWTGVDDTVAALLPSVDRALAWIGEHGDRDRDGFVEYERAGPEGLVNQGWKDSWDGINHADGRLARPPIALAEVQGYCYAAFVARSQLAETLDDTISALFWAERAATLKARFNESFWLPERGWYAVGLDADKAPVDALTSNIGHCLWTGIVDEDRAASVAEHLLSPQLFTGWGVRTLSSAMGAYNPMSYHNGSVWPHDSALCAAGLMRYGFLDHAQRIAVGLVEASAHFGHRLPELFCGFPRSEFAVPVRYPSSCSPQAWAAATPVSLLRTVLRLDPDVPRHRVTCSPAVPGAFQPLHVSGVRIGTATVTIDAAAGSEWRVEGIEDAALDLVSPERP